MRDTIVNIRITKGEKDLLHQAAEIENRSVTNLLIWLVKRFLKSRREKTATVERLP